MRTIQIRSNPVGEAVMNASRQVWLASLGAAVVTRDWAQSEAGAVFRTLVKEGTAVESRTIRLVGDRIEDSVAMANSFWKQARTTVQATVKQAADTAVTLVQNNLPKALPKVTLPAMLTPARPGRRASAPRTRRASPRPRRVQPSRSSAASAAGRPPPGSNSPLPLPATRVRKRPSLLRILRTATLRSEAREGAPTLTWFAAPKGGAIRA